MTNTSKKDPAKEKAKYWLAISYDDSAPADIKQRAKDSHLPAVCAYHDKDINELATPETYSDEVLEPGQAKKAHRHWIFVFPNSTTRANAERNIMPITNGAQIKACTNIKGAFMYLTHKHDPDKYQYDDSVLEYFNGFAPEEYFSMTGGEEDEAFKCIEKIIKEQDIEEYCDLIDYLGENFPELARFTRTHTIHLKEYLRSKHMKKRQAKKDHLLDLQIAEYERRALALQYIDTDTGEVIEKNEQS